MLIISTSAAPSQPKVSALTSTEGRHFCVGKGREKGEAAAWETAGEIISVLARKRAKQLETSMCYSDNQDANTW